MSDPILPLAVWPSGINEASIPANDNALRVEALSREVISKATTAQPGTPDDGDVYIIPAGATGTQWATFDEDDLTIYRDVAPLGTGAGTWIAWAPVQGVVVNVAGTLEQWDSSGGWTSIGGGGGGVTDGDKGDIVVSGGGTNWDLNFGSATYDNDNTLAANSSTRLATQAAVKGYVDGLVQGLSWKRAVRAATTANGTLASAFQNGSSIDGVTLATNDRILIKNQTTGSENGIYVVQASGAPSRAPDADTGAEMVNATMFVSEGSTQADTQWTCSTNPPITLGSTSLTFVQITAGGSSLTNWTEAVNTSTPNSSVPVVSWTPNNAASDVDVTLRPKGQGAIAADIADNTSTGGNKRGARSVDWQRTRSLATEVASGSQSTIGGGNRNTAAGTNATVAGGNRNSATNSQDTVCGGNQNTASGSQSFVGGGTTNTASGSQASVMGGEGNTASGSHAVVVGGVSCTASGAYSTAFGDTCSSRGLYGLRAYNSGPISPGTVDAQREEMTLRAQSTNATPVDLTSNLSAASTTNQLILISGSRSVVRGRVVASQQSTGDAKAWEFSALIKRTGVASTATLVAAVTPAVVAGDSGASAWALAVTADTTNGGLKVTGTGEASKTIKWVCDLEATYSAG